MDGREQVQGTIFDIQRNSYVDGPGLRTTVFLKGCNLRCKWCHNPEGLRAEAQYVHYPALCTRCGTCSVVCSRGAIETVGRPDADKCVLCGKCATYCPNGAIRVYGKRVTAGETAALLARDKGFYETSGGGATFSGGECMLQIDFLEAAASLCRDAGVSVAVDTAGNVPFDRFERLLPLADWFLYDLKAFDGDIHKALTGADNALILDNLRRLLTLAPEKVILRVPVIPGANDGPETGNQIEKLAGFVRTLPRPAKIELLPYHRLGESKREALGVDAFAAEIPSAEHMAALNRLFEF